MDSSSRGRWPRGGCARQDPQAPARTVLNPAWLGRRRPIYSGPEPGSAPRMSTMAYKTSNIAALESESVHIMREAVAEFERPVLLFSGGKDSAVLLRVAEKAFRPSPFPFPIL